MCVPAPRLILVYTCLSLSNNLNVTCTSMYQLSDGQYHAGVHTDFPDLNVVNSTLHSPAPNIANAIRTRMGFHSVLYLVYCQLNMTN